MTQTLLLLALNGLIWGLIIALIALGLSIIFGLLDIINIAHGDFFMVGTVLAWATLEATGNFWLGFIVAPLIGFLLGALIQRVVIQPIRNVAALSIVATFGLSLILQEVVRMTFGPTPRRILPPIQGTIPLFGIEYEIYRLFAAAVAVAALVGVLPLSQSHQDRHLDARGAPRSATPRSPWASRRSASMCSPSRSALRLRPSAASSPPRSRRSISAAASTSCRSASWR